MESPSVSVQNTFYIRDSSISQLGGENRNYQPPLEVTSPSPIQVTSIDTVGHVTPHFIESQSYLQAKQSQQTKVVSVLHLQGMPGSGKSEVARKLGADFPYSSERVVVKWHIQCSDINHDIKKELKRLAKNMVKHGMLVQNEEVIEASLDHLTNNRCAQFVDLLASSSFPILIIVEDPSDESRPFLTDFLSCVDRLKDPKNKIHVYITSKSKTTCDLSNSSSFHRQEIGGLAPEEGLRLLNCPESCDRDEKDAAKQIIERLSGSPLGLIAVKAARKDVIMFRRYLEDLENETLVRKVIEREEKHLENKHLYKAILIPLQPGSGDQDAAKHWKVICSLALLHHGKLPKVLVGRIMQYLREDDETQEESSYKNETESTDFLHRLNDFGLCKLSGTEYLKTTVTFHEVIFNAVRLHLKNQEDIPGALYPALKALASIVHKDLRRSKNIEFMTDMVPHMRSVLMYKADCTNDRLLQCCLGHIYDVLGIALSTHQQANERVSEAENMLLESLNVWFSIVGNLTGSNISVQTVTEPTGDDDSYNERVNTIFRAFTSAGELLNDSGFDIEAFISIVLQPQECEMEHYHEHSDDEVTNYFRCAMGKSVPLHPAKLREFRERNLQLFLDKKMLCTTYFVERIASVLHTMSRLPIYYGGKITLEHKRRFQWFSTISLALCGEICGKYEFAPIFLRLTASASVSIRIKGLEHFSPDERRSILMEAKGFVQENRRSQQSSKISFYEHGILKQVQTQQFDRLTHLRSIVQINAKLIPLVPAGDDFPFGEADATCEALHESAISNTDWGISSKCLVYCGKYWASRKDFAKAVSNFDDALGCESIQSKSEATRSFPWACSNHARAVVCGKFVERAAESKSYCEKALENRSSISKELVAKIVKSVSLLDQMLADSTAVPRQCSQTM